MRWRIEHDYRELKHGLGLDRFEGRSWLGGNIRGIRNSSNNPRRGLIEWAITTERNQVSLTWVTIQVSR
jgi:hypothetical protein